MKPCTHCYEPLDNKISTCPKCGREQESQVVTPQDYRAEDEAAERGPFDDRLYVPEDPGASRTFYRDGLLHFAFLVGFPVVGGLIGYAVRGGEGLAAGALLGFLITAAVGS